MVMTRQQCTRSLTYYSVHQQCNTDTTAVGKLHKMLTMCSGLVCHKCDSRLPSEF